MKFQDNDLFFIRWMKAKHALAKELKLTPVQSVFLEEWFRRYIFEFGASHHVDNEMMKDSSKINWEKEVRYMMSRKIGDMIFEKGLAPTERYPSPMNNGPYGVTEFKCRILVVGTPDFVGGPEISR